MSYGRGSGEEFSETFQQVLDGAGKLVAILGGLATLGSISFLAFLSIRLGGGGTGIDMGATHSTIGTLAKVLNAGLIGLAVGTTFLFWGSEFLAVFQLALAAALFFAPLYFPGIAGTPSGAAAAPFDEAMQAFQTGGIWFGAVAMVVLVVDVATRINARAKKGTRADQLKYGKGVVEEKGKKNVFMGKCWQLPFCREFVRERCPIYHAKTTCWKELTGCMCEESVIRNAMENKPIPKDALLAAKMIPRNNRLTAPQKQERCRNCVIYNEHQRHKYKLAMPSVTGAFVLVYLVLHGPLIGMMNHIVEAINKVLRQGTAGGVQNGFSAPPFFVETMLFVFFLIALSYSMKTIEFLIFKAKI